MKVILVFLLLVFLLALRSARRSRPARVWPLLLATFVISAAFLSQRVI